MDRCPRRQAGREQLGPKGEQTHLPWLPGQSSGMKWPRQPQCQAEQHPKHKAGSRVAALPGEWFWNFPGVQLGQLGGQQVVAGGRAQRKGPGSPASPLCSRVVRAPRGGPPAADPQSEPGWAWLDPEDSRSAWAARL